MTAKERVERMARVPSSFTPEKWVKHLKDAARLGCSQRAHLFRRAAKMVREQSAKTETPAVAE